MAIVGIESLIYGVDDVAKCQRFFEDFGLPLLSSTPEAAHFVLDEGSQVIIRHRDDPELPPSVIEGIGVREVIWGVNTPEALEALSHSLATDRAVRRDAAQWAVDLRKASTRKSTVHARHRLRESGLKPAGIGFLHHHGGAGRERRPDPAEPAG